MKKLYLPLVVLMLFSMILSACSPAAPAAEPNVEEPVVTETPVEEPVVEEAPDVNELFGDMLANMKGYNAIKADGLMVVMAEDNPPFVLDVRTTDEVTEQGHIEGATHIPLNELAQHTELLPGFDTPIVTYCAGGWRATIAMTALHGMGWTNVRALKTPYADWKDAGNPVVEGLPENVALNAAEPHADLIAAADAYLVGIKDHGTKFGVITSELLNTALAENPDLIVVDVRKASELEEKGTIDTPNYIHIPLEEFVARQAEWPTQDETIAVFCSSGHRSTMAMTVLFANGYNDVTSLSGGFNGWKGAGYATVGGVPTLNDTFGAMLVNMKGYNIVKADGLMVEMAKDNPPFILDVRSVEEVTEQGHIEGAFHIPLNELGQNIDLLPSFDTPIITYCAGGWRATIAMTALHGMGWTNVRALKVSFVDWKEAGYPVAEGLPENMVLDAVEPVEGLVTAIDAATVSVKDMGTKWGIKTAEGLNIDLAEKPDMVIVDVRTPGELAEKGIIEVVDQEFIALPIENFVTDSALWPADKDAEIVIYCGSGHRSTMAMTILISNGYTRVTSLSQGFGGWVETGFSIAEYAAQ